MSVTIEAGVVLSIEYCRLAVSELWTAAVIVSDTTETVAVASNTVEYSPPVSTAAAGISETTLKGGVRSLP